MGSFSQRRRRQFPLLLCLMIISAFAEVVSLGAVLPFIGMLVAPQQIFNYPIVANIAQAFNITSADQLVLPLTIIFATIALIAGAIRIILLWANTRLAVAAGVTLALKSIDALSSTIPVHVSRNSSEVISGITNKVNGVVFGVLLPLLTLVSATVLLVAILITLITIDPVVALLAAV